MTKAELVDALGEKITGLSKKDATECVEAVFASIKDTLERGEQIKIAGFGNFDVRDKAARKGRNPQTGEAIEIGARRVLSFKASKALKDALNG